MTKPIVVDLPHTLGAEEAKRRMQKGLGKLTDHIPGGAEVHSSWEGDRMQLSVGALGQKVDTRIDVGERVVRVEVLVPGLLGMFSGQIEQALRRQGGALLEDKSKA